MIYLNLISSAIAIAAMGVALLAYRLSRRLPNENKIFEEKIRSYQALIKTMNVAVGEIVVGVGDYAAIKQAKERDWKEQADEINEGIDEVIIAFEDAISEQALLLPDEVLDELHAFLKLLDQPEYLDTYQRKPDLDKLEASINAQFDEVVNGMREDLHFEKLDYGLKRRTGGSRQSRGPFTE